MYTSQKQTTTDNYLIQKELIKKLLSNNATTWNYADIVILTCYSKCVYLFVMVLYAEITQSIVMKI